MFALSLGLLAASPAPATAAGKDITLSYDATYLVKPGDCPNTTSADTTTFNVLQGIAYGGGKVYIIFSVAKAKEKGDTLLTRWTISGNTISCDAAVRNLDLGHGNDLAYVPSYKGEAVLLVPHGTKSDPNKKVAVVRTANLTATTFTWDVPLSAICYSTTATGYKYVVRSDKSLIAYKEKADHSIGSKLRSFTFAEPAEVVGKQGLDCSANNFYNVLSVAKDTDTKKGGTKNYVYQYPQNATSSGAWTKRLIKTTDKMVTGSKTSQEFEGMFHIGDTFYVGVNINGGTTDRIYRLKPWS